MPPDPPRSSALRASLLPLRGNYISHSIQTKNLGIYASPPLPTWKVKEDLTVLEQTTQLTHKRSY